MNNVPSSSFKLPSFGGSIKSGFVLPKLVNLTSSSSGSSNLTDFAKSQLITCSQSDEKKTKFTIPKLLPSKAESNPFEQMKNLHIEDEPQKIIIDLQSALVFGTERTKISLMPKKEVQENFIPKFIDCDYKMDTTSTKELTFDDNCELITLKKLRSRYKNCSLKRFSMMGKVIGRKFKMKVPKIHHGYEPKYIIEPFQFDTLSPDDKILAHLNKKKN